MFVFMIVSQIFKHRMQPAAVSEAPTAPTGARPKAASKQPSTDKKSN